MNTVPQPHPSRITPFAGHPVVAGVSPGQPELVILTAASLAEALGTTVYFAYADPGRIVEREFPDGRVQHADVDPDLGDDEEWRLREAELTAGIARVLAGRPVKWEFRYLAGRPDRALTHLARAVDAAAIIVGGRRHGTAGRWAELLQGAVGAHLAHHQHRPVLIVPTAVVDWKTPLE
nr:universal stress protein [Propionibacterium sp.]